MYGSRRLTYHHGTRSDLVSEHVSGVKNADVDPSIAFCGIPVPSVDICMGALPAATFNTKRINKEQKCVNYNNNILSNYNMQLYRIIQNKTKNHQNSWIIIIIT